ncbi:MAG: filamentous hemagglutinin N-terminal domain-containing protein, partial [Candidatus Omnitrophota bacterium]
MKNKNHGLLMNLEKNFSQKLIYTVAFAATFLFFTTPVFSQELPQGGTVVEGNVNLDYTQANTLNVNVGSDKVITDWDSFNVGTGNTVNFNRDTSFVSLNRVTGADPSSIFGTINAQNGQIFLVNSNGILFGQGSHVNAAGLVASTLDITNENFMKGKYEFYKVAGKNGYVINQGIISTNKAGGYICLLSQAVDNQGVAIANLGTVTLAAGEKITVGLDNKDLISVVVDEAVQSEIIGPDGQTMDSAIKNSGVIQANGGKIILTAKVLNKVFDYAINNTGVIQAASLNDKDGVIELTASGAPIVNKAEGVITASKQITIVNEISDIINEGTISVVSPIADIAVITITANNGSIVNTGSVTANGTSTAINGGRVALLGATLLQNGLISADAYEAGTAGRVEIISQTSTVLGSNSVTSAACPFIVGNGGQILVKSTNGGTDVLSGAIIDVSAGSIQGNAGSIEINAFNKLGFYGSINGRAPPAYNAANVVFSTNLPYDSALIDTYAIIISGEISAKNISLTSNQGINIIGTIVADGTISVNAGGAVQSLGILIAKTLVEKGASFAIGGTFVVETAIVENVDGAVTYVANTNLSGTINDAGAIIINPGVVIVLIGDTVFNAGTDFTLNGRIYSISSETYNLTVNGAVITIAGNIVTKGNVVLASTNSLTQTGTIIAGGNVTISGANVTLYDIYFGGTSLSTTATGTLIVNGTIESANITFTTGTVTVETISLGSTNVTLYAVAYGGTGSGSWVRFDLSSIPNSATITNATLHYYYNGVGGWISYNANVTLWVQNALPSDSITFGNVRWYPSPHEPYLTISYPYTTTTTTNYTVVNGADSLTLNSGDINLSGTNIVLNGEIVTNGNVALTATTGAITDGNGANNNIKANHLELYAATGIGSGDALETQVSNLSAKILLLADFNM